MKKTALSFSLSLAAMLATSTALLAADVLPPAPTWTGPYIGVFGGGTFVEGHYDYGFDPEMSGTGGYLGVLGGFNYDFDGIVVGIEGDYGWGGQTAQNRDPSEATELSFDGVGTIRGRIGVSPGDMNTLIYATGGYGWVDAKLDALVGPDSIHDSDTNTYSGWVVGGGVETMLWDTGLSGRLEYLYGDFGTETYALDDGNGHGGTLDLTLDNVHFVRAALVYNFNGLIW
jgi:outer membrane immunogenic protein